MAVNFGGLHAAAGGKGADNCELGAPFTGFFGSVENPPAINTPKKADKPIKLKFGLARKLRALDLQRGTDRRTILVRVSNARYDHPTVRADHVERIAQIRQR